MPTIYDFKEIFKLEVNGKHELLSNKSIDVIREENNYSVEFFDSNNAFLRSKNFPYNINNQVDVLQGMLNILKEL